MNTKFTIKDANMKLTKAQVRGARAMLGLTQEEFADLCGLTRTTILNFEDDGGSEPRKNTYKILQIVLRLNGMEFVNNETYVGVLMKVNAK